MRPILACKRFLWRFLTNRLHLEWTLPSGVKLKIRSYADWCTYNEVFVSQEYKQAVCETLAENKDRLCVLDLGANTGYFSLMLIDQFLRAHNNGLLMLRPVEASPSTVCELKHRLTFKNNRLDVQVVSGLVGNRSGTGKFHLAKEDNQNFVSTSDNVVSWRETRGAQHLCYVDLDVISSDMQTIDLIKCDIEGSEFVFLTNYQELLRKTRRLVIEFHGAFGDFKSAAETLRSFGFTRCVVLKDSPTLPTLFFSKV